MPAYNADLAKFASFNVQVVGISPDSPYSHIAWQKKDIGRMNYPLLCDFWPHGGVADQYGILRREGPPLAGISERAIFIVDKEGKIAFSKIYELGQQPPNEDLLEALDRMSDKGVEASG
jgi:peroxiredoxin